MLQMLLRPLLLVCFLLGLTSTALAHEDERIGFQFSPPRGWEQIPIRADESWIVAKYRAPEPDRTLDPETKGQLIHTPELLAIAFLEEAEQETRGGTVYKGYEDYLRANYSQSYFIEEDESKEHKGAPVRCLSIKVEGDVGRSEKKIITWIYTTELGEVALSFEAQAASYKDHRSAISRLMKSFKQIPRTKELQLGSRAAFLSSVDLAKLPPAEREQAQRDAQRAEWDRIAQSLPDGWDADEIDDVFVVTHVDKKFTKEVVSHVNAVHDWLEEAFPQVGPGNFANRPLVRICADKAEESAFRDGSGTYSVSGTHLVTYKGLRTENWEWEYIGGRTYQIWFLQRDSEVYAALPRWLEAGLREVIKSSESKRGKIKFETGDLEKSYRADLPKADELMGLEELFRMDTDTFNSYGKGGDWKPWFQAVAATRFFVNSGSKKNQEILADYLSNLRVALDELKAEAKTDELEKPTNEEEEAAYMKAREELIRARERQLLDRTFELTFGDWDKGDWMKLQRTFGRSL